MASEALITRKAAVEAAIAKIHKGGQVIQTRNGRVQMASLTDLLAELADIDSAIAAENAAASGGARFGTPMAYYSGRD